MRPRAAKRSTLANWANQEGAAIITILVLFSLMAVLVSAILIISRDERRSAGRVSESTRSRILTDLPASLVIAQIRAATEIEDTVWASQPGAIRTLENNGDPGQIYKLYSAARMLAEDRIDALDEDLDETWIDHPDVFADLNAPVARGKSNDLSLHFPILDPRATTGIGSFSDEGVEGFSYDTSVIPGAVEAVSSGLTARLPMPVAWLYVLEDGTLGTLDKSGFFNGPNEASTSNPIVARIAFWTDDESCKVNINTAVEGSFWDTPRFNTVQERAFGKFQPVFGEYSRYPGHPATTSLSAVLAPGSTLDPSRAYDMDVIQELHNTSPRIAFGGSMFGTVSQSNGYTMPPAREALFATVDELAFNPDRSLSGFDPNPLRFFLTTSSRAPEVNLFNQPRMAMWPIHADVARSSGQSAFGTPNDELIAFCATAGGYPYFYQRAFANDPIREFFESADGRNATLFNWLRRLTAKPHPGYGDSFADKYGSDFASDRDQILAQVFDYIRCTNLFDPHLADPSKQYTGPQGQEGHGQVTGLMLVPPNVNYSQTWQDSSLEYPKGIGRMLTISEAALVFMCNAEVKDGQIQGKEEDWPADPDQPLRDGTRRIQMGLLLEGFSPAHGWTGLLPSGSIFIDGGGDADPVVGAVPPPTFKVTPVDANGTPVGPEISLDLASSAQINSDYGPKETWITWGANAGPRVFANNPVYWSDFLIPPDTEYLQFSGNPDGPPLRATLTNERVTAPGQTQPNPETIVQSFQFIFPPSPTKFEPGFPLPELVEDPRQYDLSTRLKESIQDPAVLINTEKDVVRSLVPNHNDYRLVAAKRVIPTDLFVAHPRYSDKHRTTWWGEEAMGHALTESGDSGIYGATLESSVGYAQFDTSIYPDFVVKPGHPDYQIDRNSSADPRRGVGDPRFNGEWDNGYSKAPPGSYINRPDDGDVVGMGPGSAVPYFEDLEFDSPGKAARPVSPTFYAPNKVVPSPAMLGSVPTGIRENIPWETLLFRPPPSQVQERHYGVVSPPDHLLLDLFWMPVVEPYAISEPFSTAGKINMNYQMVPFSHIRRATGMHAILKNERVTAIPTFDGRSYKTAVTDKEYRHPVNVEETLRQFEDKFHEGKFFHSASQICDIHIVPEDPSFSPSVEQMRAPGVFSGYWGRHLLTGDNSKERIYTTTYPRLTTRSNVFRVHYKVQTLKKSPRSAPDQFDSEIDAVASSAQGSTVVERYIDPNHPGLPDFAESDETVNDYYAFRTLLHSRFSP